MRRSFLLFGLVVVFLSLSGATCRKNSDSQVSESSPVQSDEVETPNYLQSNPDNEYPSDSEDTPYESYQDSQDAYSNESDESQTDDY